MTVRYQRTILMLLSLMLTLGSFPDRLLANADPVAVTASTITSQQATNDASIVYYQFNYTGTNTYYRVYIDTDQNPATGLQTNGIGANYLLENNGLWVYAGAGTDWTWNLLKTVTYTNGSGLAKWSVARNDIGEGTTPNQADLVFQVELPPAIVSTAKYIHTYSGGTMGTTKTVTYSTTTALFANPERGFYRYFDSRSSAPNAWTVAQLQNTNAVSWLSAAEEATIAQAYCLFYLDTFQRSNISTPFLQHIRANLTTIRNAGRKCILRFAYTWDDSDTNGNGVPDILQDANRDTEPDLPQLLTHIDQLKPILQEYADIIVVLQTGFIGIWGEWYYTDHFVDNPTLPDAISAAQYERRKQVIVRLLDALPASRMIALRYPLLKKTMFGRTTPITEAEAFQNTPLARIGVHNDAFLNAYGDSGTFQSEADRTYLQAESVYLTMGGEVNAPESGAPARSCANALGEMAKYHWSYINTDYYTPTLQGWKDGKCIHNTSSIAGSILDRLGYRLVLKKGVYPTTARPGGNLTIRVELVNEGFAAPFNPRDLYLVLQHTSSGAIFKAKLPDDPRRWLATGQTHVVVRTVTLPASLAVGPYALYLHLADPNAGLSSKPQYAIRLANANLWKTASGWNDLLHTVNVSSSAGVTVDETDSVDAGIALIEAGVLLASDDPTAVDRPEEPDQTDPSAQINSLFLPFVMQ